MINWQMRKAKPWLRTVSCLTALIFTVTSIGWADGASSIHSTIKKNKFLLQDPDLNFPSQNYKVETSASGSPISSIIIPKQFGKLEEQFQGTSGRTVFFIQDAHTSLEAQINIARLINHLVQRYHFSTVFEEGYEGKVPSDTYFRIPSSSLKRKVSYFFLDHLRLGGAEFAHINRKYDFDLIGIDPLSDYLASVKQFEKASQTSKLVQKDLGRIESELEKLASRLFPKTFQSWWKEKKRFLSGKLSFDDFLKRTLTLYEKGMTDRQALNHSFPHLANLQSALEEADPKKQVERIKTISEFNGISVFKELEQVEKVLATTLLSDPESQKLFFYMNALETLKNLGSLKATDQEYQIYKDKMSEVHTRDILQFLTRHKVQPLLLSDYWEEWMHEVDAFYSLSIRREKGLTKALQMHWDKAVLVFGGFHKKGILERLRENGISYLVINPAITREDPVHEQRYHELMSGTLYPFERIEAIPQAARPPNLYVYDIPDHVLPLIDRVTQMFARSEMRTREEEKPSELQFDQHLFHDLPISKSVVRFEKLLAAIADDDVLKQDLIRSFQDYLEHAAIDDMAVFLKEITPVLNQHFEYEFLRLQVFLRILHALERPDNRTAIQKILTELTLDRKGRFLVRDAFDALGWGGSPQHDFFYRTLPPLPFEKLLPKLTERKSSDILVMLQNYFEMTADEMEILKKKILPEKSWETLTTEDWKVFYEALDYENTQIQESRIGGMRRVRGIKRWEQKVSGRSIFRGAQKNVLGRLSKIYGYSPEMLKRILQEEWPQSQGLESLTSYQWLLIEERLHIAAKKRFEHMEQSRYEDSINLARRVFGRSGIYWNTLRKQGVFKLFGTVLNDLFSILIGIFVRWPIRFLDALFLGFFRTEFLYEHVHRNKDFLGQIRSEAVLRQSFRDFRNNRKTLSDRWQVSIFGAVSRFLDQFWLGSFLKATLRLIIYRAHVVVILILAIGAIATLGVPLLSMGWLISVPHIAALKHFSITLTLSHALMAAVIAASLMIPRLFANKYRQERLVNPAQSRWIQIPKTIFTIPLAEKFWKKILVLITGLFLADAELNGVLKETVGRVDNPSGRVSEIDVSRHAFDDERGLHRPFAQEQTGVVESDALLWTNETLKSVQDQLGISLSDWIYQQFGGEEDLRPAEIIQAAHLIAQIRTNVQNASLQSHQSDQDRQTAAIFESLANQDQKKEKAVAFDLLFRSPEESVRILKWMHPEQIGRFARAYAKDDFKNERLRISVIVESLKELSPANYWVFKLVYQAAFLERLQNNNDEELWIQSLQAVADSPDGQSKEVLRAVVTVLDDLEPSYIAELLKRTKRDDFLKRVLDEAPFVQVTRKERLIEVADRLGFGRQAAGMVGSSDPFPGTMNENNRTFIRTLLGRSTPSLEESVDVLNVLYRLAQTSKDPQLLREMELRYEKLKTMQREDGAFPTANAQGEEAEYRSERGYANAGTVLIRLSRHFEELSKIAALEEKVRYQKLSDEARQKGLATASYAYRLFRALVNQNQRAKTYAEGHNYPDMIELFDEAYQATGERRWYEAFRHVSQNILQNQIVYTRRVMPEYREIQATRYSVRVDAESVDLFKALELGDPRLRFTITRGKAPAFEVGPNEELGQTIVENNLEVIQHIVVHKENGEYLDTLSFHYGAKGILTGIQSEHESLESQPEKIASVKTIQVYQQDAQSGIPYGMVYEYIYNEAGQLQYLVKKERVTLTGGIQRHPVNTILKDASGRALMDLDIPEGFRPDQGNFRTSEDLNAEKRFDSLGRTLHMLYRVMLRAEQVKDWRLAAYARQAASTAILSFYDVRGKVHRNEGGLFYFYDWLPQKGEPLRRVEANAGNQAHLLFGIAPWAREFQQAEELYAAGMEYFNRHEPQEASVRANLALAKIHHLAAIGGKGWLAELPGGIEADVLRGLDHYIRYGEHTTNFKFATVNVRRFKLDRDHTDAIFLHWEPIPQAMWYLVREYRRQGDGSWKTSERSDRWVRDNFMALEDQTGKEKQYVVIGFTADPIFESFGPFHGVRGFGSEPKTVDTEKGLGRPGRPHLIIPERHFVGGHEEWIDLGETFEVVAREMKRFPHAHGAEWEIASERDFRNKVATFKTEKDIPRVYLRGLPTGNYYIRVRLWSDSRESQTHAWQDLGQRNLPKVQRPEPVVNEDINGNGIQDPGERDLNKNGIFDRVFVRDHSVISWTPSKGAAFYRVNIGYRDADIDRFVRDDIITSTPFVQVRAYTSRPVNWIEITPYTAHPELGGIPGPASGRIRVPEIAEKETLKEMSGLQYSAKSGKHIIEWQPVPGAKVYHLKILVRGPQERSVHEDYWTPEFATAYELQRPAKFVRIQAWSDHPAKGGRPLSDYSMWTKVDAEFAVPEAVRRESIQLTTAEVSSGLKIPVLSFERLAGVAGYYVTTRHHRGGAYRYWVAQPPMSQNPSVSLVMDADVADIQATTDRIHGALGPVTSKLVHADVPFDNQGPPYQIFTESEKEDFNQNGRQDPTYFYYDLSKVQTQGMRVYIQYATQYKNREVIVSPLSNGLFFYPRHQADRVQARIVRVADNGAMIVSDWSEWKDVSVRVDMPPAVTSLKQEGSRTVGVPAHQDQRISGYQWETRLDLNDPRDETQSYRTIAKYHNGRVYAAGNRLEVPRQAKWVRVKAVLRTDYGEVESEKWSDWFPADVQIKAPAPVTNIRMEEGKKIIWNAHQDKQVNAYQIEMVLDPYDTLEPRWVYTQRIIREHGKVMHANNEFEIPVPARYVRITPLIIRNDDDRIIGVSSAWTSVRVKNVQVLERMNPPTTYGRLVMGTPVKNATHYKVQTMDHYGVIREFTNRNPWTAATGGFIAFRMQPLIGQEKSGQFVTLSEGEWSAWQIIREVKAPYQPVAPDFYLDRWRGIEALRWNAEYVNEKMNITRHSYIVELEDADGNRVTTEILDTPVYPLTFRAVRARVKALRPMVNPQGLIVIIDSESDWSAWKDLRAWTTGLDNVPPRVYVDPYRGETLVEVRQIYNAGGYKIEWQRESGEIGSISHIARNMPGTIRLSDRRDPIVRVRVQGFAYGSVLASRESPLFDHGWVDVPGRKLIPLPAPDAQGRRPYSPYSDRRIVFQYLGFNKDGHIYWLGREGRSGFQSRYSGYDYLAYVAVEESHDGVVAFRQSAPSPLVPTKKVPPIVYPESAQPVAVELAKAEVISWDPVAYRITIQEKGEPHKTPFTVESLYDYPPNSALPLGREKYEWKTDEIFGYEVVLTDAAGNERVVRTHKHYLNLGDLPEGRYASVKIRYLTQGDFRGVHSDWSDARALNIKHKEQVLYIRPADNEHYVALFSDGTKVFFSRNNRMFTYAIMPTENGEKRLAAAEIPDRYRLEPAQIFPLGERWENVRADDLSQFNEVNYRARHVMQTSQWRVDSLNHQDERPFYLPGIHSTGTVHLAPDRWIPNERFSMHSKGYKNANPGSLESKWSSNEEGLDVYTRKYLIEDTRAGVLQFSIDARKQGLPEEFTLALKILPHDSATQLRVRKEGEYRIFIFPNGQFVAVQQKDLKGWYLGPEADAAERESGMKNNIETYEGPVAKGVLYLHGKTKRLAVDHGPQGIYNPELGDRLNQIFIFTGEAKEEEITHTLQKAVHAAESYEKAFESFAKHGSRQGRFPREVQDIFFKQRLSNTAWRQFDDGTGTYWEIIGMNEKGPLNVLWSDASWTGNSSLMQQLNIRMFRELMRTEGHDKINERGEKLLDHRIVPNANWLVTRMQTPTDAFYMKSSSAMRLVYSEGHVFIDNQLMSAIISNPRGIPLMRGYEPLDAFTIAGSGFGITQGKASRNYDLRDADLEFRVALPEEARIDPAQDELKGTRVYDDRKGAFRIQEHVLLKKGEYGVRYSLDLEARQAMKLNHVSVALSHLDADQNIDRNPAGFPGFPGENGLVVPGVGGVFRARELFEKGGLPANVKGQWIDLMTLFQEGEKLSPKGQEIRKALKEIGAIGIMGWDKGGVMYLKEGIDYGKGYRIMVKVDEREDDEDEDHLLEFTDLRLEMPIESLQGQLQPGDRYASPTVYFSNFWVRLGVTDHRNEPEDLKYMMMDWIRKIDGNVRDGISMESDYAYTENAIALWETANLMLDEMTKAEKEGRNADVQKYRDLARRYASSAMLATTASRDADKSVYDLEAGTIRRDVMNSKGIMRFYGSYTVVYGMARDFTARVEKFSKVHPEHAVFVDASSRPVSIYEALISRTESQAGEYLAQMQKASTSKDAALYRAYWEIHETKAARLRLLDMALRPEALTAVILQLQREIPAETDAIQRERKTIYLHEAQKQQAYSRVLQKYTSDVQDYWSAEILWSADRILMLQEKNPERKSYGGFYQNEQPSKMQLDDNGTKLWALRVAYESVDRRIQEILSTPGLRTVQLPELTRLYERRHAYSEAAKLNIESWVRVDERDGHLYGWESHLREQDFDSQRTEYGNAMYRYHGLGSWMDLIPAARSKFDLSSRQHMEERPDGSRNFSPRGFKMYLSYENPGNGHDTSTEVGPTELMAYLSRAQGGNFSQNPEPVRWVSAADEPAKTVIVQNAPASRFGWIELLALLQLALEATVLGRILLGILKLIGKIWKRVKNRFNTAPFVWYELSIVSITGLLGKIYIDLHDLSNTRGWVLILMGALSYYVMKNIAETVVRYFKIGLVRDPARINGNVRLDTVPFHQAVPMHLGTMLSVPLYTTQEKDARVGHGSADENNGAFHQTVMKNLEGSEGLFFHLNDQSPDRNNENGFNPKAFHESYIRAMIEKYGYRFVYTHQSGQAEKKLGAVQQSDSWWYAVSKEMNSVVDDLWNHLTEEQKKDLTRAAYGREEKIQDSQLGQKPYESQSGVKLERQSDERVALSYHGVVSETFELPVEEGRESQITLQIKRQDGNTALIPFWVRREGEFIIVYHYNENPEGDNVLVQEVVEQKASVKKGLLPIEKEEMIEEEARALLYRFWASEFGGTADESDGTKGRAVLLNPAVREQVRGIFTRTGTSAEEVFGWDRTSNTSIPGGIAEHLSLAMVRQSLDYWSRLEEAMKDQNVESLKRNLSRGFDPTIVAWTDVQMVDGPIDENITVPFELEIGQRAIPGKYYRLNPNTLTLEVYDNPALAMIDQTSRILEAINKDTSLDNYAKKKKAEEHLTTANTVLRNIHEIGPVVKHYEVHYNHAKARTEVLEEQWIAYEYFYEDGAKQIFFRPERKVRFDTLIGHLPTIGPLSYIWRFDNDTTVDQNPGERNTLVEGILRAGHPDYQPVLDPISGQTVAGYGGLVLFLRVANARQSLWAEMESRNRDKITWDLEGQWQGFGEAQYTGKGIENLASAERSKANAMPKGFYLSHDMLEAGYSGPGTLTMKFKRTLEEQGLLKAFLQGASHSRFKEAVETISEQVANSKEGQLLFTKYGRPISKESLTERLLYGARGGGMGLLVGLWGYEDYFMSHRDTLFKVMGQWKKGDFQWWHASWFGLDVRGTAKLPGAMPGYTIAETRTLEQTVNVNGDGINRVMTGQDYKPNPLTGVQKYFLARTVEEDQRAAIMFIWLMASLVLAALNHQTYTFLNLPVLSYFIFFGSVFIIVMIMKFATVLGDIRRDGLTIRNAKQLVNAASDTVLESIVVSGINLWKGTVSTLRLIFRVPGMKWITGAQLGERSSLPQTLIEYGVGVLVGFSLIGFIIAFHPTWTWLIFGSVFLGSLILGPFFAWIAAKDPTTAHTHFSKFKVAAAFVLITAIGLPWLGVTLPSFGPLLMVGGWYVGIGALALLGILAATAVIGRLIPALFHKSVYIVKHIPALVSVIWTWMMGLFSFDPTLAVAKSLKENFSSFFEIKNRLRLASVRDYFLTRGIDRTGFLSSRYKALGNLIVVISLWGLPILFPQFFVLIAFGNAATAIVISSAYLGLFFPVGFYLIDKLLTPERPFRWYRLQDYIRAVYHLAAALIGNAAGLLTQSAKTIRATLVAPYDQGMVKKFIRTKTDQLQNERGQKVVRKTAQVLKYAPATYRRKTMIAVSRSEDAQERFVLLTRTGILDNMVLKELSDTLFERLGSMGPSISTGSGTPSRSELRFIAAPALKNKWQEDEIHQNFQALSQIQSDRSETDISVKVLQAFQEIKGAVILDAKSLERFSEAQKAEVLKTALSGRAQVIIYNKDATDAKVLHPFYRVKNIRVLSEGFQRAETRLAGYNTVVQVVAPQSRETMHQNRGIRQTLWGKKIGIYQQVNSEEEGLLTAALLVAQYGDKFRYFRQENGIYILADESILKLAHDFLTHELIAQAA